MQPSVTDGAKERRVLGLNPNVFFLGMVSLLTDVSNEMIFTFIPLFLSNVLGGKDYHHRSYRVRSHAKISWL